MERGQRVLLLKGNLSSQSDETTVVTSWYLSHQCSKLSAFLGVA